MKGDNTNKLRAVFLAVLMTVSVFAGTVAFAGSAAAQEYAGGAVEYQNSSGSWIIEVPLESGSIPSPSATKSNITLLNDGNSANSAVNNIRTEAGGSRVILNLNGEYASEDLEVEFGDSFVDSLRGTYSVAFAGTTYTHSGNGGLGGDKSVLPGEKIAVVGAPGEVRLDGADDSNSDYFQTFSNGTNSQVFYINTDDLSGDYEYDLSGDIITVRDLGLSVSVDETTVTNEAGNTIEGTVTAVDASRSITVELLDNGGNTVATDQGQFDGQGEYDFSFSADREPGSYTVEVTDDDTQDEVESSTITVTDAQAAAASFATSTVSDQRGDIVSITVQMEGTDHASITVGAPDQGVLANVTLQDGNDDGQATVYLNTYELGPPAGSGTNPFDVDDDSDDSIEHWTVTSHTSNLIDAGEYDLEVRAGDQTYGENSDSVAVLALEERSTQSIKMWTGAASLSPTDLSEVNEALGNNEITQSSQIAVGDYAVHQLKATGLEGLLEARANEDVTSQFATAVSSGPLDLTIEEANQDASALDLDLSGSDANVRVIADGADDTYYIIVDTSAINFEPSSPRGAEALPKDEDTALETNFTVLQDDAGFDFTPDAEYDDDENSETLVTYTAAEPDISVDEPYNVSQASGQTIRGDTNIAPGTEMNVRIRSKSSTSPSFLKTASPTVQPDGTFKATVDFSSQNVGDEYDINVDAPIHSGDVTESGTVVQSMMTPTTGDMTDTTTATPEPDTATPTPDTMTEAPSTTSTTETSTPTTTPGFGVVVALTALIAAALLAIRRD